MIITIDDEPEGCSSMPRNYKDVDREEVRIH